MCETGEACAICLNSIRKTRHTPALKCGHVFHPGCLDEWTGQGGETCPLCRKMLSGAKYRVTLTIENLETRTSNSHTLPGDVVRSVSERLHIEDEVDRYNTDIMFDVDSLDDLVEVLGDFGIPNANALILDAE